jgi:hypothetical protein
MILYFGGLGFLLSTFQYILGCECPCAEHFSLVVDPSAADCSAKFASNTIGPSGAKNEKENEATQLSTVIYNTVLNFVYIFL